MGFVRFFDARIENVCMASPYSVCVFLKNIWCYPYLPNLSGEVSSISRLLSQVTDCVISERVSFRLSVRLWPELKRAVSCWTV